MAEQLKDAGSEACLEARERPRTQRCDAPCAPSGCVKSWDHSSNGEGGEAPLLVDVEDDPVRVTVPNLEHERGALL